MVLAAALVNNRSREVHRDVSASVRRAEPADRMVKSTAETYTAKLGAHSEAHAKRKRDEAPTRRSEHMRWGRWTASVARAQV